MRAHGPSEVCLCSDSGVFLNLEAIVMEMRECVQGVWFVRYSLSPFYYHA